MPMITEAYLGAKSTGLHGYPAAAPIASKNVQRHIHMMTSMRLSQAIYPETTMNTAARTLPAFDCDQGVDVPVATVSLSPLFGDVYPANQTPIGTRTR